MTRRGYAGGAKAGTLIAPVSNSGLTLSTSALVGWPDGSTGFFSAKITTPDGTVMEKILCASYSSGTITVQQRGYDSTTAVAWSAGAIVTHISTSIDADEANAHISTANGVHGLAGGVPVVGATTSQTLTNKSMSGGANTFTLIPLSASPETLARITAIESVDAGQNSDLSNRYTKAQTDAAISTEANTRLAGDTDRYTKAEADARYLTPAQGDTAYVNVGGDTMTGPLVLPADPTLALQAAPKQYVDVLALKFAGVTATKTTNTGSITAGLVSIVAAPSVTVDGTTPVEITVGWDVLTGTTDGDLFAIGIFEGATEIRGIEYRGKWATDSLAVGGEVSVVVTPPAGAHVYELKAIRSSGSGIGTVGAAATSPSCIRVRQFR